jgi:glycerophosphoryl diester phosphodiesterase
VSFLDHHGPLAFAHRGGAAEAPENSLRAFEHAYALGYRWFETDVQATADGELVLFHDRTLRRTAETRGDPARLTLADLDAVLREHSPEVGGVLRLADLADAFPDARLNIDPKHDAAVPLLARLVRDHGLADRVCLASFSDARLQWLRAALGSRVVTGLGPREVLALARAARLGRGYRPRGGRAVQVPPGVRGLPLVDHRFVTTAHRAGLAVHVWTVDDAATMHRLLDLGVDGIMTDRPSLLRDVLQERGEWVAPPQEPDAGPGTST